MRWLLIVLMVTASCTSTGAPTTTRAPQLSPVGSQPSPSPTAIPALITTLPLARTDIPGLSQDLTGTDLVLDAVTRSLFLSDPGGRAIHAFELSEGALRYRGALPLPGAPRGLLLLPDQRRLVVALSGGHVALVEMGAAQPALRSVGTAIAIGGEPTALGYAPADPDRCILLACKTPPLGKVYVATEAGFVAVVDTNTMSVVKRIDEPLGGRLGGFAYHPGERRLYLVAERALNRLDPHLDFKDQGFDLGTCTGGMAIDAGRNQAFLSCRPETSTTTLLRWDFATRKISAEYDQVGNASAILFDAAADRWFVAAARFGRGPVVSMFGGSLTQFVTNVPTSASSTAVAYDATARRVYVPGPRGLLAFDSPPPRTP